MELDWRTVTGDMFWPDVEDEIIYEQNNGKYTTIRIGYVKQAVNGYPEIGTFKQQQNALYVEAKYEQKDVNTVTPIMPGFRWAPWEKVQ